MGILKVVLSIILAFSLYFLIASDPPEVLSDGDSLDEAVNNELIQQERNRNLPDYDPRKRVQKSTVLKRESVESDNLEQPDTVIQRSESKLMEIQQEYSQVLDDPVAKKKLETEAKAVGAEFKKAILIKLQKGEL